MDWNDLVQDTGRQRAFISAVMNLRVPQNSRDFSTSSGPVRFSRRILPHGVWES